MRVLVVEDFDLLRDSLVQGLREAGYAVDAAADGEEGLWYAQSNPYDVIVLDLMLPKIDGLTLLRKLREQGNMVHVLVLTAKDAAADRVLGLDSGADDYLIKPFALDELFARVRALVRRKYHAKSPLIRVGDLEVDTAARLARRGGRLLDLSPREYVFLEFLAARAETVVTRTELREHLYDFNTEIDSNVVDVFIAHLRKKVEQPGRPRLIHTRRGHGYVLGEQG